MNCLIMAEVSKSLPFSGTLLHYQMVDCCEGNNCNGAGSFGGGGSALLLAVLALLLAPALHRL